MYLEVQLPNDLVHTHTGLDNPLFWTYGIGNAMIKTAEIEIGGQLIDRQYGEWMNIWTELTTPEGKKRGYDDMVGNWYRTEDNGGQETNKNVLNNSYRLYIPLQFWFNRNAGLALPLIALQYHEVKLNIEFRPASELMNVDDNTIAIITSISSPTIKLFVDYIYLDTDERRRFAQVSHEYLIEQVQFTGDESIAQNSSNKNITLNFNHPVKELIWVHVSTKHATSQISKTGNRWLNFAPLDNSLQPELDTFGTAKIQLNGHDRFTERNADYFRKTQNYQYHTRVPRTIDLIGWNEFGPCLYQYIYTYSFGISPEEHQPSGTCNFSRIDNAVLSLNYNYTMPNTFNINTNGIVTNPTTNNSLILKVFAVNYNVLRIMSGMGGLAYSN